MSPRAFLLIPAATLALGAAGYGLYHAGMSRGIRGTDHPAAAAQPNMAAGKQVLYWHDPMVPGQKFDKPGKSPFMDMQLVPVYADSGGDEGALRISPRMQQNLGVRTADVTRGTLSQRCKPWAVSPTTSATWRWCRRAQRLRGKTPRARAAGPGAQGPAACRNLRSRMGCGAGRISFRPAHGNRRSRAAHGKPGGRRPTTHATGRHERSADPADRIHRQGAWRA